MPAFLFLDTKTGAGGSTCAAFRYVNGTPTQIGNTFGTSSALANIQSSPRNLIVQFQGQLFAMAADGIYKKDDPTSMTGGWTSQIAFTTPDTDDRLWGLYPVEVAGTLQLVGVFGNTGADNVWRWVKFDGAAWTQAVSGTTIGASIQRIMDVAVYHGVLYAWGEAGGAPATSTFDPGSDSFSSVANPGSAARYINGMCVFRDRLFAITNNLGQAELAEFTGGSWAVIDNIVLAGGDTFAQGRWALFTDGTNMYTFMAIGPTSTPATAEGWKCFQWDSAIARTDISAAVLPSIFRPVLSGGTYPNGVAITNERFLPAYDLDTTPGSTTILFFHAANSTAGTVFTVFQWNGNAALITQIDTGGNVYHALPSGFANHGERIWTAGEADIKPTARLAVLGGEQLSFIAYGGATGLNVKLLYALDGEPVLLEGTLSGPITGGSASLNGGLNRLEGIDADGVTVYTFVWDAGADGVASGTRASRTLQLFA